MHMTFLKKTVGDWSVNILSFSIFVILAGLLLVPKTSNYHTIYYISAITPILLLLSVNPKLISDNISNVLKIFIIFSIWSALSTLWSDTDESIITPIKRIFYIFCLFISFSVVHSKNKNTLIKIFILSGTIVTIAACYNLLFSDFSFHTTARFIGPGALKNPLLSSHIFGFFTVLFFSLFFTSNTKAKFFYILIGALLLSLVIATGSRTPLLALTAAAIWIIILFNNRKSIYIILSYVAALALIFFIYPEIILNRGVSYRPELWNSAIEKILSKPFIGYGFESSLKFYVPSLEKFFEDPHNIHLSTLSLTGLIGFILWCAMHIYALWACWKNKKNRLFIIASTLLIYGIMAGMTEGGGLLPRPKEHWFLTWIPLAFIAAIIPIKKPILDNKDHISLQN